jgi:uncharacterized protein YbjT (DUF2867 family)
MVQLQIICEQLSVANVLVIGASGFLGRRLVTSLLEQGHKVRCLARRPAKIQEFRSQNCEIVAGDISNPASLNTALMSMQAVYILIHTLSPQPGGDAKSGFMGIEKTGIENVIAACEVNQLKRAIYVTSLGISPVEKSEWLRERWQCEQLLIGSNLDVTIIRPGFIVGAGGRGFEGIAANARRRISFALGGDRPKMRTIAVGDLVYYLTGVLDETRACGQIFDVGNEDVMTINQLIDGISDVLGTSRPYKMQIPLSLLGALSPIIERAGKYPAGAFRGFIDAMTVDSIGDPQPIRKILPRRLLNFIQAVEQELIAAQSF